jgi:ketosteroid isomerase-like protein
VDRLRQSYPKITSFTVDAVEIVGRGDLAYATGKFKIGLTMPDGSAGSDQGSFIEIHRKQADGAWPYTRLMWHSDNPVAVPAK